MGSPSMRPSPFARPTTPSTVRATSPQPPAMPSSPQQPTSPMRSPERQQSPFIRRPSQPSSPQRAMSPFAARPPSRLNVTETSEDDSSPSKDAPIPFKLPANYPPSSSATNSSPLETSNPQPQAPIVPRPQVSRTVTAYSPTTVRAPPASHPHSSGPAPSTTGPRLSRPGTYSHVPPALLHTMRESFEVLDPASTGVLTPKDLASMLEQLGLASDPNTLATYFASSSSSGPGCAAPSLNLARFLDGLAGPMRDLSDQDELSAAFGAFDVDDSGQIDLAELRGAVLDAGRLEGGGGDMSVESVDGILDEFRGRRAFGAKGVLGKELGGSRGDVFRYRDFLGAITGGGTVAA